MGFLNLWDLRLLSLLARLWAIQLFWLKAKIIIMLSICWLIRLKTKRREVAMLFLLRLFIFIINFNFLTIYETFPNVFIFIIVMRILQLRMTIRIRDIFLLTICLVDLLIYYTTIFIFDGFFEKILWLLLLITILHSWPEYF